MFLTKYLKNCQDDFHSQSDTLMKEKIFLIVSLLIVSISCTSTKSSVTTNSQEISSTKISFITNKAPYDPRPGMEKLKKENVVIKSNGDFKLKKSMHFLVFGDSKGSERMQKVLNIANQNNPQFCLTTADLVNKGAGKIGLELYKNLDKDSGWFFRKYPTWPTIGNHEVYDKNYKINEKTYASGVKHFGDFFGITDPYYSFTYGNAKFIALDWIKVSKSPERLEWLEKELKEAQGKFIFIFKHRPYYTVGSKSYKDIEGKTTEITKLYSKYKVTAVFSGHDHLYYRTLRDGVNYIISAGAGASVYKLKRESDAIPGDSYYGRKVENKEEFKFHPAKGEDVTFNEAMYYILSVKIKGKKVTFEMIDTNGKVWDKFTFKAKH